MPDNRVVNWLDHVFDHRVKDREIAPACVVDIELHQTTREIADQSRRLNQRTTRLLEQRQRSSSLTGRFSGDAYRHRGSTR